MRRRRLARSFALGLAAGCAVAAGCLPGSGPPLIGPEDGGVGGSLDLTGEGGGQRADVSLGDPFAIEGVQPSHGPFTGGTRVVLTGRGFTSKLRVWVGGVELPAGSVLASDPTRAAIVTPPGPPGYADIKIRDDGSAKERVLSQAFLYDAFVVEPDTGATSGGTRVVLRGSGTSWGPGTRVAIGGAPCEPVQITSATQIDCVTAPGAPGAKDVVVTDAGGAAIQARDAFTYNDSPDGYRGGLSGGALAGRVRVLAFDAFTGTPLADAWAIAGSTLATAITKKTSATGVAEIQGPTGKVTVTVAAKCHQPITYVDVPVDTVTAYLAPVLDPECAEGDPPSTGGGGGIFGGVVSGSLVFPAGGGAEFERAGWTNIPLPTRPTERRAAYVFEAATSPTDGFTLPAVSEAITPDSPGTGGYAYSLVVYPGNVTLYVVAGLEDRSESPPRFLPYAMGVARGVTVAPRTQVTGVDVRMDVTFDHTVTIAPSPPAPGPRGPDRLSASVAVTLGASGFAVLPGGTRVTTLPAPGTLPFVGVPALDRALAGEQYVLSLAAATGANLLSPASVVSRVRTTTSSDPVAVAGFLGVPVLSEPGNGAWTGTHVEYTGAQGAVDISVSRVVSGGGLVTWTVVAPGAARSFDVPDLASLPGDPVGLRRGAITTTMYVARLEGFSYGRLRSRDLGQGAWSAHAFDTLAGAY